MKLTIQEKEENGLLDRIHLRGELEFESVTPSNNDVAAAIGKQLSADARLVVVKHIYAHFGHRKAAFEAVIYKTTEAKQKTEKMTKHLRKKLEEDKKSEESKKGGA